MSSTSQHGEFITITSDDAASSWREEIWSSFKEPRQLATRSPVIQKYLKPAFGKQLKFPHHHLFQRDNVCCCTWIITLRTFLLAAGARAARLDASPNGKIPQTWSTANLRHAEQAFELIFVWFYTNTRDDSNSNFW